MNWAPTPVVARLRKEAWWIKAVLCGNPESKAGDTEPLNQHR